MSSGFAYDHGATRQGWSERSERCDKLMKFGSSSSGCDPRPAKGEPARPVESLATAAVTRPAMRRHASMWAVGMQSRKYVDSRCRGCRDSRRLQWFPREWARGDCTWRDDRPRHACKRTIQAPGRPRFFLGILPERRRPGDHSPTRRALADARAAGRRHDVAPHRRSIRTEVGRWRGTTGATDEGNLGSRRAE